MQDNLFSQSEIDYLKTLTGEEYWFQNYHLILNRQELLQDIDNSIETYLIPESVKLPCTKKNKVQKREAYLNFYKTNLQNGNAIIRDIADVKQAIMDYLELRMEENEEAFDAEEE